MNTISFQGAHKSAKQQPKKPQTAHQHLHKPASKQDQHGDSFSKSDKVHKPTKR